MGSICIDEHNDLLFGILDSYPERITFALLVVKNVSNAPALNLLKGFILGAAVHNQDVLGLSFNLIQDISDGVLFVFGRDNNTKILPGWGWSLMLVHANQILLWDFQVPRYLPR